MIDFGDAGHILLSSSSAEVLQLFETWSSSLRDPGTCKVKHGALLHLYNLCLGAVGNPALPQKLQQVTAPSVPASPPLVAPSPSVAAAPTRQVALLYKRNAPHAAYLLQILETALTAGGYQVFVDCNLPIGIEWAQAIKRQVETSFAVVPLLSTESIWSEMMEDEIVTAHEVAQLQNGLPRLLPIRVAYEGPLPEPMAHILNHIQHALWQGPQDDERLTAELLHALESPSETTKPISRERLEPVGGAVPLDSTFYIARATDAEFHTAVRRRDSIVLVKGARQMGKTSLLARGLQQARQEGAQSIRTDFQKLTTAHLGSADSFFLALAEIIAEQLDLDVLPEESGGRPVPRAPRRAALSDAAVVSGGRGG